MPSLALSAIPVVTLLLFIVAILVSFGASSISEYSVVALCGASVVALVLSLCARSLCRRGLILGFRRSARQILPAVPMLVFIAMISATWMLSGVVPVLIDYGLRLLDPRFFLVVACGVCAVVSVLTGSSWSTIATIGVAFMGIGSVMGFHPGWVAGAIISGAYFGDKVSPLSDTTVVASSACGVDLFKHIRYLLLTSVPSLVIAMIVFALAGFFSDTVSAGNAAEVRGLLADNFNMTPWVLVIPAVTFLLIALRVPTLAVLAVGAALGLVATFVFQPQIVAVVSTGGLAGTLDAIWQMLWGSVDFHTGSELFDGLVSTSGVTGMLSTIALVLSAMVFGSAMIGTGMLSTLTSAITSRLSSRFALVGSTVASGLFLNSCTADQYLSIIIGGNMFRNAYRRKGLEARLLSRTLEDSVSVTSVLIPWNSCGVTQSAVLGVATVVYLPFCVFNYLSPLMSLLMALTGFKIKEHARTHRAVRIQQAS